MRKLVILTAVTTMLTLMAIGSGQALAKAKPLEVDAGAFPSSMAYPITIDATALSLPRFYIFELGEAWS